MEVQGAPRLQRSPAAPAVAATQGALELHRGGGACARCNGFSVVCPRGRHTSALYPPSSWESLLPLHPIPCTWSSPEHDCDSGKGPGVAVRTIERRQVHASIYTNLCTRPYLQCLFIAVRTLCRGRTIRTHVARHFHRWLKDCAGRCTPVEEAMHSMHSQTRRWRQGARRSRTAGSRPG